MQPAPAGGLEPSERLGTGKQLRGLHEWVHDICAWHLNHQERLGVRKRLGAAEQLLNVRERVREQRALHIDHRKRFG